MRVLSLLMVILFSAVTAAQNCERQLNRTRPLTLVQKFWLHKFHDPASPPLLIQSVLLAMRSVSTTNLSTRISHFLPAKHESWTFDQSQKLLGKMLYILSFSQHGRELLDQSWALLNDPAEEKKPHIFLWTMPVHDGASKRENPEGYFWSHPEARLTTSFLEIRGDLTLADATAVFAHELLHAYDYIVNRVDKRIPQKTRQMVFLEDRSIYYEYEVVNELIAQSKKKSWPFRQDFKTAYLNGRRHRPKLADWNCFVIYLSANYGVPWRDVIRYAHVIPTHRFSFEIQPAWKRWFASTLRPDRWHWPENEEECFEARR